MTTHRVAAMFSLLAAIPAQSWQHITPPEAGAAAFDLTRSRTVLIPAFQVDWDTWIWAGTSWTSAARRPGTRAAGACAYDLLRDRVVTATSDMFASLNPPTPPLMETWEFDGTNWSMRTTANAPSSRYGFGLAYDIARVRVVLFGGTPPRSAGGLTTTAFDDTWEFDGTNWTRVVVAGPSPRHSAAMAYDLATGSTVLFGGVGPDGPNAFATPTNDTWIYDGLHWTNVSPTPSPSPRSLAAMTADPGQSRLVLFGGTNVATRLGDTWEWRSGTWSQITPTSSPPPMAYHAMAFDWIRHLAVLQGGNWGSLSPSRETWEYDGANWVKRVTVPAPRQYSTMTFDRHLGRAVLFSGSSDGGSTATSLLSDTWLFDGTLWTQAQPAQSPPARRGHASAYDARSQRTWVFGGARSTSGLNDLWSFDGVTWSQANVTAAPPQRQLAAMSFDTARARLVLFGGGDFGLGYRDDTWEFDGATWRQALTAHRPSARSSHAMAYDARRGVTVMFGGQTAQGGNGETWEYDGVDWRQAGPIINPSARFASAITYDEHRAVILLCGGSNAPSGPCELWQYDGSTWQQILLPAPPGIRFHHALAYDPARELGWIFGGEAGPSNDTWAFQPFAPAATFARYGLGCTANGLAPVLDAAPGSLPSLGSTFTFALSGLSPNPGVSWIAFGLDLQQFQGAVLPIDLGPLGLPGCLMWNSLDLVQAIVHAGAAQANTSVAVPTTPSLAGLVVGAQAVTFDNNSPNLLGAVSNGSILQLR